LADTGGGVIHTSGPSSSERPLRVSRLRDRADRLRIARPRPGVLEAVHAAGVHPVLRIYETVEDACAADPPAGDTAMPPL
jgi:hypothetical protein